jgi:hypothetical protein
MADVKISQAPHAAHAGQKGGRGWLWAILGLILLAIVAWLIFGGTRRAGTSTMDTTTLPATAPADTLSAPMMTPMTPATPAPGAPGTAPSTTTPTPSTPSTMPSTMPPATTPSP